MNTAVALSGWQSEQDIASEDWKGMDQAVAAILARWLRIGRVLIKGKLAENRRHIATDSQGRKQFQSFADWATSIFPNLGDTPRADAIWLSQNYSSGWKIPDGLTHPTRIKAWFNTQQDIREVTDPVLRDAPAPEGSAIFFAKTLRTQHVKAPHARPPATPRLS
jgi:hypothetical protein